MINREILGNLLQENYEVHFAENGKQALDILIKREHIYSLILLDLLMPVMDGLKATEEIRKLDRPDAKTVPIIAMTANAFSEDIQAAKDAGMNDHISKPIDVSKLTETLGAVFAGKAEA